MVFFFFPLQEEIKKVHLRLNVDLLTEGEGRKEGRKKEGGGGGDGGAWI